MADEPVSDLSEGRSPVSFWLRVAVGLGSLAVLAVLSLVVFVMLPISRSYPDDPVQVDALVVLAGSNGDRLDHALVVAGRGASDTLLLNTGIDWAGPTADRVARLCADGHPQFTIACVSALPDSTKGEAQTLGKLAEESGFDSLGIVTSESHMHRAVRWFDRCSDADIVPVAVPKTAGSPTAMNEFLSSTHSLLVDRSCFPG